MNSTEKLEVIRLANQYLAANGITDRAFAKQLGTNESYMNQLLKGNLQTSNGVAFKDSLFTNIAQIIGYQVDSKHWDTELYLDITAHCADAIADKKRVLIDGRSGAGKTYSLERFAKLNPNVIYVKATSSMTAKDLLGEILEALHTPAKLMPKTPRKMLMEIREKVAKEGYLLIIDELEDVRVAVYKTVKEIADFCENRCGLVICGIGLIQYFNRKANAQKTPFMQLKRRFFANTLHFLGITAEEVERFCKEFGIKKQSAIKWFQTQVSDFDSFTRYINDLLESEMLGELKINEVACKIGDLDYKALAHYFELE